MAVLKNLFFIEKQGKNWLVWNFPCVNLCLSGFTIFQKDFSDKLGSLSFINFFFFAICFSTFCVFDWFLLFSMLFHSAFFCSHKKKPFSLLFFYMCEFSNLFPNTEKSRQSHVKKNWNFVCPHFFPCCFCRFCTF